MKRCIYYILIGSALAAAACSPASELEQPGVTPEPVIAVIGAQTRTHIGEKHENAYKVAWDAGDRIIISTGTSSKDKAVYATTSHGSAIADFYPEENIIDFSNGAIAGYPAENMFLGAPDEDKEVYFTMPQSQTFVPGSFDLGAMPMISAVTDKPELNFFNAAGVIRFMLSTELPDIKIASITVTSSAAISGECGYIPKTKKIFFDDSMLSSNEIKLECPEGVEISEEGTAFHLVVPHKTYSDLKIKVTTTDNLQQTFTLKSGKEINIERSSISTIPLKVTSLSEEGKAKINARVKSVSFETIRIEVSMENVTSYFCGLQTKLSFLTDLESDYLLGSLPYTTPYTGPDTYSGSVTSFQSEFQDILIEPGQSYVLWFVPYKSEGIYTSDDIVYVETMTKSYSPGGTKKVTYTNLKIDYTSISMRLSSTGAGHIYSQLLTVDQFNQYISEDEIIHMLLAPGSRSTIFDSDSDTFERKFLKPGTSMILVALAIDRSGKYGPLFTEEFITEHIRYNSMQVTIDKDIDKVRETSAINWTVSGGAPAEYRYIIKETSSYLWSNTLEGSVLTAQEKMYLDPGLYYIGHTNDSKVDLKDMITGEEYIVVAVAADADGNISVADSWTFTY